MKDQKTKTSTTHAEGWISILLGFRKEKHQSDKKILTAVSSIEDYVEDVREQKLEDMDTEPWS